MTALHKRKCGPCTVCCTELKIPQLRKQARVPCQHLTVSGCGIYQTRPDVCREFLCGWRLFEEMGDDWRPDLSGVMALRWVAGPASRRLEECALWRASSNQRRRGGGHAPGFRHLCGGDNGARCSRLPVGGFVLPSAARCPFWGRPVATHPLSVPAADRPGISETSSKISHIEGWNRGRATPY